MIKKNDLIEKIKSTIEEISLSRLKTSNINSCDRIITDLELDSLDYASILFTCESWSHIKIKEEGIVWSEVDTVEKLAELFMKNQ